MTLTRKETAARLGISVSSLDRLCKEGKIAFIPVTARRRVFRPEDIDSFLAKGAVAATSEPEVNRDPGDETEEEFKKNSQEWQESVQAIPNADQIAWDMAESKDGSKTVTVKAETNGVKSALGDGDDPLDGFRYYAEISNFDHNHYRYGWIRKAAEVLELAKAELTPLGRKAVDDLLKRLPVEVKQ